MTLQAILLPLFVQVGLIYFIGLQLAKLRWSVVLRGEVRWQDIALRERVWPGREEQLSNSFQNQFEIPVLFYVLVVLAIITKKADLVFVIMEWLFVTTRIAHAYVHTTSNYVPLRGPFFILGSAILFIMWLIFAIRIFAAPMIWAL